MAGLDTLNITDSGFFNINKKIVSSKTYSSSLITVVGKPIIVDGVASSLSAENYLTYSPLAFRDTEKISISFKGTFGESNKPQSIWELISPDGDILTLTFENTKVTLTYGNRTIFSFGNLNFTKGTLITTFLSVKSSSYEFTLHYGKQVSQKSGEFPFLVPLSSFNTVNIGNSTVERENAWAGSVDLKEFTIYNNSTLLYSPSTGTPWNFSNILVSDGKIPLTDSTEPSLGHIYSFPLKEISRSGNAVLLTCQIDEGSYITIREIGLYIQTPKGKVLFGFINNLNVNKTKDLKYDLVFTVNTTVSVVNAIGFPAEDGIIVKDPDFVEFKDYTTIQQVNTYVLTNLERIIRMNAGAKGSFINSSLENNQAGIGYNRPQVIYKLQQELESQEDCYNTIDTFTKLTNRFQQILEEQVNYNIITIHGDLKVPVNGEVNNFSNSKYITSSTSFSNTASWELNTSFDMDSTTQGTLISLENSSDQSPLELKIANNRCSLKIWGIESIEPYSLGSYYLRDRQSDFTNESNINYYSWRRKSTTSMYNFHCSNLSVADSSVVQFPQAQTLAIQPGELNPSNFMFSIRVMFNDIAGTQYIIGKASSSSNKAFELMVENGKIRAWLYDKYTGESIADSLISQYNIQPNRYYNISLSCENRVYQLHYSMEMSGDDYGSTETITIYSPQEISMEASDKLVVGSRFIDAPAATTWSFPVKNSSMNNEVWCAVAGSNRFSALSTSGYTVTSTDGVTWTAGGRIIVSGQSISIPWKSMAYGKSKYVSISENGYISTSTNGAAWAVASLNTNLSSDPSITWNAIAFGRSRFVAIDKNGYVSTSTTGTNWGTPSLKTALEGHEWIALTYGVSRFVALSNDGYISTSSTGSTWSTPVAISENSETWNAIAFLNNTFAVITSNGYVSTSTNGTTWSEPSLIPELSEDSVENINWIALGSGSSKIIALDKTGYTSISPGGNLKGEIDFSGMSMQNNDDTVWNGAVGLNNIFTKSLQPSNNEEIYDEEEYLLQGPYVLNYVHNTIINSSNLFTLSAGKKYNINISYNEDETTRQGTYKITYMTNDNESTKTEIKRVISVAGNLSNRMDLPTDTYIGNNKALSNPFSSLIHLMDWYVEQEENSWHFGHLSITNNTKLLQYYRMPDLNKSQYVVKDICNLNRTIRFLSSEFEGNEDLINLAYPEGLTLCVKVNLKDTESKVLLYKSNLVDDIYFSLTFIDQTIAFTMVTKEGTATLYKQLTLEEYDSYTREPIMLSIILTPQYDTWYYAQMYRNNDPITESQYIKLDNTIDPIVFILSNYIEDMPTYTIRDDNNEPITMSTEPERYVSDIVVIKGPISDRDLFYINNLFDTNY